MNKDEVMEYTIVEDCDVALFLADVNRHILAGWQPLGGVAYSDRDNVDKSDVVAWYVQAMTRPPRATLTK